LEHAPRAYQAGCYIATFADQFA